MINKDELENIPENERWLFENKKALEDLQKGLEDAFNGRFSGLGRQFQQYLNEDKNDF